MRSQASSRLQIDITRDEIASVLMEVQSSGPGIDGVQPESFRFLSGESEALDIIHAMFQRIFESGITPAKWSVSDPESWEMNRIIMHYKGKNSDPCCVENYRPLGVGAVLVSCTVLF